VNDLQTVRAALEELASNYSFSWHPALRALFERIEPELWQRVEHNPKAMLADLSDGALGRVADDTGFRVALEEARRRRRSWSARRGGTARAGIPTSWSPTSRPSSGSMRASRSTRAGSACSPATT
jgi:hypothetical protein